MHARIATFGNVRPEQHDVAARFGREEFVPRLRELDGYAGSLALADREGGIAVQVALFESRETAEAGHGALDAMSPPPELEGIRRLSVEQLEVLMQELSGEPGAARLTRYTLAPERIDETLRTGRESILPQVRQIDGFQGVLVAADRETGSHFRLTFWRDAEAMEASEEQVAPLREQTGEDVAAIERYEVVGVDVRTGITAT